MFWFLIETPVGKQSMEICPPLANWRPKWPNFWMKTNQMNFNIFTNLLKLCLEGISNTMLLIIPKRGLAVCGWHEIHMENLGRNEDNNSFGRSREEGKPGKLLTLFIATASPHRTQVDQSCPDELKFQDWTMVQSCYGFCDRTMQEKMITWIPQMFPSLQEG